MSVIIKGMTMPETCYECRFCETEQEYPFRNYCVANINFIEDERRRRLETCPLVESKRGKWEMKPDHYGYFDLIPVCTACGCTTKWREKYSFCPNCGADMRERSESDGEVAWSKRPRRIGKGAKNERTD